MRRSPTRSTAAGRGATLPAPHLRFVCADEISPWNDLDLAVVVDGDVIGVTADGWRERLRRNPFGLAILAEAIEAYARPEA